MLLLSFPPLWLLVTKLIRAPITVTLPEIVEHRRRSWCGDTSRNTQEKPKICTYRMMSCLREDTVISSLASHTFYVSKQHSPVMDGLLWSQWHKEKSNSLSEILTIQFSGELSRNKGFLCGNSQTEHFRKDPPRSRGSAWQHKHEAEPALESSSNDRGKPRDAPARGDSDSAAPGDAQGLNWLLRQQKKFVSCWSSIGWGRFPGRAGQAVRVYVAAALPGGQRRAVLTARWRWRGPCSSSSPHFCSTLPWPSLFRWEQLHLSLLPAEGPLW